MGANEKREGGEGGTGCVRGRQRRARAVQGQQRQGHDAASQSSEREREGKRSKGECQVLDDGECARAVAVKA